MKNYLFTDMQRLFNYFIYLLIPTFAYIIEITKNAKEGTLRIITNIE